MRVYDSSGETGGAGDSGREPRERNPRGQGERLRDEAVAALVRLIGDDERMRPLALSLREVARAAGVTAPALYRHFQDKEELARAAEEDGFRRLVAAMDAADESADSGVPSERLAAQARAYCRFAFENPGYFRLMFKAGAVQLDQVLTTSTGAEELALRWRTAVVRLRDQGVELSQSPEQAALFVWSCVHGRLVLASTVEPLWPLGGMDEYIDKLVESLVKTALPFLKFM